MIKTFCKQSDVNITPVEIYWRRSSWKIQSRQLMVHLFIRSGAFDCIALSSSADGVCLVGTGSVRSISKTRSCFNSLFCRLIKDVMRSCKRTLSWGCFVNCCFQTSRKQITFLRSTVDMMTRCFKILISTIWRFLEVRSHLQCHKTSVLYCDTFCLGSITNRSQKSTWTHKHEVKRTGFLVTHHPAALKNFGQNKFHSCKFISAWWTLTSCLQ